MSTYNAIVAAFALILAPGCSRCLGTIHITDVSAKLAVTGQLALKSAGGNPWISEGQRKDGVGADSIRGAIMNTDTVPSGGLELTLFDSNIFTSYQYIRLSLPIPLAAGQVIQVLATPPPLEISSANVYATQGVAPQGKLRIDPFCYSYIGHECEPELVTGTFTVASTRPLSVHVDTTVTVSHASGSQEQIIVAGDLTFAITDGEQCDPNTEFN